MLQDPATPAAQVLRADCAGVIPTTGRPAVRLVPVIVGGAVATVAPEQGIDEGLTDKLAVAIG